MVAKVKNLVALAPVLGAISRPVMKIKLCVTAEYSISLCVTLKEDL